MNNVVALWKTEEGELYCREISAKGIEHLMGATENETDIADSYWKEGGTIVLDELMDILDKPASE